MNRAIEYIIKARRDSILKSRPFMKAQLLNNMRKNIAQHELKIPFIKNNRVEDILISSFGDKYGGVKVIVAPPGAGKTTYIRGYVNNFINNHQGKVQFFGSEINTMDDFYRRFGDIERRFDLFELLPQKSVIVIDQIEHFRELPMEMENLILHLACESRRTAECNIVIVLSDIKIARTILALNGSDKIKQSGKSSDFQWNSAELLEFVKIGCSSWSDRDKTKLIELGNIAMNPGFLHDILGAYPTGLPENTEKLVSTAIRCKHAWELFDENEL